VRPADAVTRAGDDHDASGAQSLGHLISFTQCAGRCKYFVRDLARSSRIKHN
jgi:hypothetical protein